MSVVNDLLKIKVNVGAINLAQSLISLAYILSGSEAFEPLVDDKIPRTPLKEICPKVNVVVAGKM